MFAIQNILDDIVLGNDCRGFWSRAMALKCSKNLERLFVLALADEQTWRVGQEWAQGIDTEGEEELES